MQIVFIILGTEPTFSKSELMANPYILEHFKNQQNPELPNVPGTVVSFGKTFAFIHSVSTALAEHAPF